MSMETAVSIRIVERVAERDEIDPVDLRPPLHDVVDPEALDALVRPTDSGRDLTVTFTYRGYEIRVDGSGEVHVTEPNEDARTDGRSVREFTGR